MSDGSLFRDYVCNMCLPTVAMDHAHCASREVHPYCLSLVEYNAARQNRFSGRGGGRGDRGDGRGDRGGGRGDRGGGRGDLEAVVVTVQQ